jgi:D-inositol-3-phosphate glycosyltransferase
MPRVLVIGLTTYGTGFARVLTSLFEHLNTSYELHCFGLGGPDKFFVGSQLVHLYRAPRDVRLPCAAQQLRGIVDSVNPQIVFLLGQAWWLEPLLLVLQPYRSKLQIVNYMPIEGNLTDLEAARTVGLVDHCILYTEFARKNLSSLCQRLEHEGSQFCAPKLHVLPHGIDTETFWPCSGASVARQGNCSRVGIREKLFPGIPMVHAGFLVLNANHPSHRKRLDITLKGFAQFAEGKPENVFIYLHQTLTDGYTNQRMRRLVVSLGLEKRVLLNVLNDNRESLSEQQLNLLYNACDVGISTSMGEGWGLISFEHAATGAAQIVPAHTSFIENWTGAADLLRVTGREYLWDEHTEAYIPCACDLARKLERLYEHPSHLQQMSSAAYGRATSPKIRWSRISHQLDQLFCECIG